jgi:phosphatidate phosphatase APP1
MNATHTGELESGTPGLTQVAKNGNLLRDLLEDQIKWSSDRDLNSEGPVDFVYTWEEAFARTLDQHGILWQYKYRTFAVEWDDEGNFVDSFTPDFYLPLFDLYVELIVPNHDEAGAKAKKVRLLRQQRPGLRIELLSLIHP